MVTSSASAPPEGRAWQPGRSGNTVSWDGTAVVKRHAGGAAACLRELAALGRVADLPVPRVQPGSRPDTLRLAYVPGRTAADLVAAGQATSLLRAVGDTLRRLQAVDPSRLGVPAPGLVLCHGDFAPYNVIGSEDGSEVRALVDWEMATLGDPLTDLAWCEWQFARLFPRYTYALAALFAGYGESPSRRDLEAALRARMAQLTEGGGPPPLPDAPGFEAQDFGTPPEAAAFAAAVSRAAAAPFRERADRPAEMWLEARAGGRARVLLNQTAQDVMARAFPSAGRGERVEALPPSAQLVFLAGHVPPLGLADVLLLL
jgi:aminoglycoside phosphotransferase